MSEQVLEVVIRCERASTAEWVLRQVRELLDATMGEARLEAAATIDADAYDAPQPGDAELLARVMEV